MYVEASAAAEDNGQLSIVLIDDLAKLQRDSFSHAQTFRADEPVVFDLVLVPETD